MANFGRNEVGWRRCGGKVDRVVDWEVSHSCGGKSWEIAEGEKCRSCTRRSRSDRERSSMKFIRFCILSFWRVALVSWVLVSALDLVSIFVFALISVCLVGLDIEEYWYGDGWIHFGAYIGFKKWAIHSL
jgi:hypothetical protein